MLDEPTDEAIAAKREWLDKHKRPPKIKKPKPPPIELDRTCIHCNECKPPNQFRKKKDSGRVLWCKGCSKQATESKQRGPFRQLMAELKAGPCMDCGGRFHACAMEFDHREPNLKSFSISDGWREPMSVILEELAKCDLVCSNCHKFRTWSRTQKYQPSKSINNSQ